MAEGARLESVFRGNSNVSSNLTLSAILDLHGRIPCKDFCVSPAPQSFYVGNSQRRSIRVSIRILHTVLFGSHRQVINFADNYGITE